MTGFKTYSEQIAQHIKNALLSGELAPGQKINEVSLASKLGISRAPVREGLQRMVSDGLVISIPQRGKFVRSLTQQEIRENYELGGVLEGAVVANSSFLLTDADFSRLEAILLEMQSITPCDTYASEYERLDRLFHELLTTRQHNQASYDLGRKACQRISKFLLFRHWPYAFTQKEFVERHKEVLDAVKTHDRWHIETIIRKHYCDLGERMAIYGNAEQ